MKKSMIGLVVIFTILSFGMFLLNCDSSSNCTSGQVRCNGNLVQICENTNWVDGTDCASSGRTCLNGACIGGGCINGRTLCSGNEVQTCSGGVWQNTTDCTASGMVCSSGACTVGCTSGQTQCSGNELQTCTNNTWVSTTDCFATGGICQVSGGVAQCIGTCSPDCNNKTCGENDGCNGKCTDCPTGQNCNTTTWQCQTTVCYPPTAGAWYYSEYAFASNTCNTTNPIGEGDGSYGISNGSAISFVVTPGDGANPFTCTLNCSQFTCHRAMEGLDLHPTYDAVLGGSADVDGTMSDANNMSGTQIGLVTCEGTSCAAAATYLNTSFPCNFSINFTGSWQHAK